MDVQLPGTQICFVFRYFFKESRALAMSDDDHGMATKPHRAHHPSPSLTSIQAPHHTTVDRSQPTTAVRPAQHSPPQPTTAQALSSQESFYTSHCDAGYPNAMPTPHRISSRSRASFAPKMLHLRASLRVFAATSTARRPIPNSHLWTRCRRIARHYLAPPPFHSHSRSRSRSRTYLLCRVCVCVCCLAPLPCLLACSLRIKLLTLTFATLILTY